VRSIRWLIIVLCVLPWLASGTVTGAPRTVGRAVAIEDMSGGWRRTREGWERIELFRPVIQYRRPALHPAVVGSLEILLTMTAMLALSRQWGVNLAVHPQTIAEKRNFPFPTKI